ncbi:MAG: helix-turn-helix domain-containing protein [Treponema sp.]|nr:helix-turn-helix domain-containing protein [Treponema sp.]
MSFRENLKDELEYTGMLVKELAAASGVSKKTLDKYLLTSRCCMPPADKAAAIARVLGVSVEYLVTGKKTRREKVFQEFLSPELRVIADLVEPLSREERKITVEVVTGLVKLLQNQKQVEPAVAALTPLQRVFLQLFSK